MKKLLTILAAVFVFASNSMFAASGNVCGKWNDVNEDDPNLDAYTDVCELGFFRGGDDGELNVEDELTRIEVAVILNRIFKLNDSFDPDTDEIEFVDDVFQEKSDDEDFQWIFDAVFNASKLRANGSRIFKGYSDGTFKPFEGINFVEFAKVIVLGLKANKEAYYVDTKFDFSKKPWYADIFALLRDFRGASAIEAISSEKSLFRLNGGETDIVLAPGQKLTRMEAIIFLSALLRQGYIAGNRKYIDFAGHFEFRYPYGFKMKTNELGVSMVASKGLTAVTGLQRIAAGRLTLSVDPSGVKLIPRDSVRDTVASVRRHESCDTSRGLCQVAYFFTSKNSDKFFLEISYLSERVSTAKELIEGIYQSFKLI